jgi:hypothetical protein
MAKLIKKVVKGKNITETRQNASGKKYIVNKRKIPKSPAAGIKEIISTIRGRKKSSGKVKKK